MPDNLILLHDPLRGRHLRDTTTWDATTWDATTVVTLQTSRPVAAAWVRSEPDNEEFLSPLVAKGRKGQWFIYEGELRLNPADEVTRYAFKVLPEGAGDRIPAQVWLSELGQTPYFSDRSGHFRYNPHYTPVPWLWSQVFYQIFPERFYDGDPGNNVTDGEYLYEGELVGAKV